VRVVSTRIGHLAKFEPEPAEPDGTSTCRCGDGRSAPLNARGTTPTIQVTWAQRGASHGACEGDASRCLLLFGGRLGLGGFGEQLGLGSSPICFGRPVLTTMLQPQLVGTTGDVSFGGKTFSGVRHAANPGGDPVNGEGPWGFSAFFSVNPEALVELAAAAGRKSPRRHRSEWFPGPVLRLPSRAGLPCVGRGTGFFLHMQDRLRPHGFRAFQVPGFRTYLVTFWLTMMADNIEHVISYWLVFQKFQSAALGGFAVVAHWLPYLLFSMGVGALNDRFDSRRLIQIGAALFIAVSLGWGYFFATGTLEVWHAMLLLVLHGCAGVFWMTSSQVLLYDIVGPDHLESAIRLNATARYLGTLVGPGVGSVLMLTLGPIGGIFVNACFYLPLMFWLMKAPYGRRTSDVGARRKRAVSGVADIVATLQRAWAIAPIRAMLLLAGAASFFVGNSYQAQMPGFAVDLGHADPGVAYASLLAADACGALLGGFLLESRAGIFTTRAQTALGLSLCWALSLLGFALMRHYWVALPLLFLAGFFELAFGSMAQTLVQMNAPETLRGRVLGVFSMASSGLRTFSGLTVGWLGSVTNIRTSLALAAGAFLLLAAGVFVLSRSTAGSSPRG
jgi:MFS family permease